MIKDYIIQFHVNAVTYVGLVEFALGDVDLANI